MTDTNLTQRNPADCLHKRVIIVGRSESFDTREEADAFLLGLEVGRREGLAHQSGPNLLQARYMSGETVTPKF